MLSFFTKNLGLKFLSLLLAISLWVYVAATESRTDYFPGDIPIIAKNVKAGLAPVFDNESARVKILASGDTWSSLVQDDFVAYINLKDMSLGTHEVDVKVTCSAPGVQIVEINPTRILVRLEREVGKDVNVSIKITGNPAEGYGVVNSKVTPDKAQVKGAESVLSNVKRGLALVELNGEAASFDKEVDIIAQTEDGKAIKNIRFEPAKAKIEIEIIPQGSGKVVGIKIKTKGQPKAGFWVSKITTNPSTLNIIGEEKTLKDIDYIETKEIDLSGISQQETFNTEYLLPQNVSLAEGEPTKCEIVVTLASTPAAREVVAGISYTGLVSGLKVDNINPAEIKVVVSGDRSRISSLNSDNVVLMIELAGLGAGSHRIDISKGMISTPSGVAVVSVVPSSTTVTLSTSQ